MWNIIKNWYKTSYLANERGCFGGGSGPSIPEESQAEKDMKKRMGEQFGERADIASGVRGMPGQFGIKTTSTGEKIDNPDYRNARDSVDRINTQIEELTRSGGGYRTFGSDRVPTDRLGGLRAQLSEAKKILQNTPEKIDTTKKEYTALTEAERTDPSSEYYDPNYTRTLSNLGLAGIELDTSEKELGKVDSILNSVNTDIGEMSRVTGLAETEITNLIQKYKDYDTQTKNQILALTGANDEQATRLSNQINYLTTIQTDVEKTRGLAEGVVQKALAGEVPDWLQQQINEDVNRQVEEQSRRFGAATAGRRGEIATRTKLDYIPQMLGIYDPIASGRTTTARGLTGDIISTGQTKLGNLYELENIKDRFATQGVKNWQTTPTLYGGLSDMYGNIATKRTGLAGERTKLGMGYAETAKNRALLADTYNKFGQQGLQNIIDYTNIGA